MREYRGLRLGLEPMEGKVKLVPWMDAWLDHRWKSEEDVPPRRHTWQTLSQSGSHLDNIRSWGVSFGTRLGLKAIFRNVLLLKQALQPEASANQRASTIENMTYGRCELRTRNHGLLLRRLEVG